MAEFKQNAVSATVWPWTGDAKPSNAPKGLSRQVRALIQTVIMVVIAGVLYKFTRHGAVMSKVVLFLAAIVLVSGLFIPPVFRRIEQFGQMLGRGVSVGLTWGLLTPFFYLCFVPGRAFQAVRGVDPMQRRFPTGDPTYWYPRAPVNPEQYRKQH